MKFLKNFRKDTQAATAIEYGLIAALIAVAAIAAMSSVGTGVTKAFSTAGESLKSAAS
jgi:pilus assembly protein Flp/PilA